MDVPEANAAGRHFISELIKVYNVRFTFITVQGEPSVELLSKMERKRKYLKIGTIIVSGIVIIVVMFAIAHYYQQTPEKKKVTVYLSDLTETIIGSNSTVYVGPDSSTVYHENFSYNSTLIGAFRSSGNVTFYVLNKSELSALDSGGKLSYLYTTGESLNASIHVFLPAGEYYLEFHNNDYSNPAEINITEAFTISFNS